jgi:16S rRNA (uracil1498-N3)-methyltransferase
VSYHRFFLEAEPDFDESGRALLPLTAEDAHHALRVLRLKAGESVDIVAPSGTAWRVEVEHLDGGRVAVRLAGRLAATDGDAMPEITLVQGVAKGEKMDAIVRAAVEIGATRIAPIMMERSVVKLDAKKARGRGERWRRIARSAAQQARRGRVPEVTDPLGFEDAVKLIADHDLALTLWEECDAPLLSAAVREGLAKSEEPAAGGQATADTTTPGDTACARIAVVVGPEGGLIAEEVAALESAGATTVTLGPSILRTETAAVAALGIVAAIARETCVRQ